MIARLSEFLRLTLRTSEAQEVTLKQELEFLDLYLEIMRTRFEDRLKVDFAVPTETLNAPRAAKSVACWRPNQMWRS